MKLSSSLSLYLYQHHHLHLPGIGSFSIDPAAHIPDPTDKNYRESLLNITFKQANIGRAEDALIEFIRTHTGKIKPLAESDLESYLSDGKLLVNIGKPFYIEGIGTLHKNKDGSLEFIPGEPIIERIEGNVVGEHVHERVPERKMLYDTEYNKSNAQTNTLRKLLIALGVIIGLGVIVWGGYLLYSKNTQEPEQQVSDQSYIQPDSSSIVAPDSLAQANAEDSIRRADSLQKAAQLGAVPAGSYKFVFETTDNKERAIRRYLITKKLSPRVQIETKDSITFKIFVVLPSNAADTLKKKDSLNAWYWGTSIIKVKIEQ